MSARLAELLYSLQPPRLQSLIASKNVGCTVCPSTPTPAADFFSLASGDKDAPHVQGGQNVWQDPLDVFDAY